jgi:hypothetical protein
VRVNASQGQHRAIVLSLKVAELQELEHRSGQTPLLLLDDVPSELDRSKSARFFELLLWRAGSEARAARAARVITCSIQMAAADCLSAQPSLSRLSSQS